MSKSLWSIWLFLLGSFFAFAVSLATNQLRISVASVAYDGLTPPKVAYEEASLPVFSYDSASVLPNQSGNRSIGARKTFGSFAEFLITRTATKPPTTELSGVTDILKSKVVV